ncbi:MAG: hypothetical protein WBB45_04725 [Cyclobacteriaceae bacterium]
MSENSTKHRKKQDAVKKAPTIPLYVYVIGVVAVFLLAYSYTFNSKIDINGDNANYYMLGKALAEGEGYVSLRSAEKAAHNHFPPGYPVLIAGVTSIFGDAFTTVKIFNGLLLAGSAGLLFFIGLHLTRLPALSAVASVFLVLNAYVLQFASMMMSELPFIFFSLFTFYLFLKLLDQQGKLLRSPYFYLTLLCLIMTYYIRAQGVALLGAMILALAIRKRFLPAVVMTVALVAAVAPWMVRSSNLGGNSYVKQLFSKNPYAPQEGMAEVGDFTDRILNNFSRYITTEIPESIFPSLVVNYRAEVGIGGWLLGIIIAAIIIYGLFSIPRLKWFTVAYVFFTMGILMLWPHVWVGTRFMLPLVPFLLLAGLFGLHKLILLGMKSQKMKPSFSPLFFLVFAMFLFGGIGQLHDKAEADYPPAWHNYFEIAKSVKQNAPGSQVICRKPTLFHIFSGSPTSNFKKTTNNAELIEDFTQKKVDFVVVDNLGYSDTYNYLYPAVQNNPQHFQVAARLENPDTYLLRFIP